MEFENVSPDELKFYLTDEEIACAVIAKPQHEFLFVDAK